MKWPKINFTKLLKKYKKGWVGISEDFAEVVVSGNTLAEVRREAQKINKKVYFFPAGESYSNFVGTQA